MLPENFYLKECLSSLNSKNIYEQNDLLEYFFLIILYQHFQFLELKIK
jgi:hypothetical protein